LAEDLAKGQTGGAGQTGHSSETVRRQRAQPAGGGQHCLLDIVGEMVEGAAVQVWAGPRNQGRAIASLGAKQSMR
jgi:hypothetical protein